MNPFIEDGAHSVREKTVPQPRVVQEQNFQIHVQIEWNELQMKYNELRRLDIFVDTFLGLNENI